MRIQREMRGVDGEIVVEEQPQEVVAGAGPGMLRSPEQSVVHDQQVRTGGHREFHRGQAGIDGGGEAGDAPGVLHLETVDGTVPVAKPGGTQPAVAMADEINEGRGGHGESEK